jgi:hypothetical protein
LFSDSNVYINPDFCVGPPTVGCATFDGLDAHGLPYGAYPLTGLINPATGLGEYLTSQPINLSTLTPADSVYFSFLFQPQGRGESPEQTDFFSLWFFDQGTNQFDLVWQTDGTPFDTFKLVMIPVVDTAYFKNNFRFQFRRSGALYGMFDQWNVDYIYMDKNRNFADTTFNDVGFVYKAPTMLRNYQQMPFNQFNNNEFNSKIALTQTNLSLQGRTARYRYLGDYNLTGSTPCDQVIFDVTQTLPPVYTGGYNPFSLQSKPDLVGCAYGLTLPADTTFILNHIFQDTSIVSGFDMIPRNDTVVFKQIFSDYYSYDDGTAEAGFFLSSQGSMAARYSLNYADTLRAVHFYFVKGVDDVSNREFYLRVWGPDPADPDKPGPLLYEKRALFPMYSDSLNEFVTYTVDSIFQLPVGNFFVGWNQPEQYILNVGFDKNLNHGDKLFYKVGNNGWIQNSIDGALMMRPVVGDSIINPLGLQEPVTARNLSNIYLYPNPTADRVFIANVADFGPQAVTYSIFNLQGLLVDSGKLTNAQIDIAGMSNGLYFVRFDGHKLSATRKLIIAR